MRPIIIMGYQCAGKRTFATPKPNPNPQNQASSIKTRSKVPKTQKTGCAYSEHFDICCIPLFARDKWYTTYIKRTLYQLVTNRPKSRFSAAKKIGFLTK